MPPVGAILREDTARRVAAMSAEERLAAALALGDDDVAAYAATHGVPIADARRQLARSRQVGRRPSCANHSDGPA